MGRVVGAEQRGAMKGGTEWGGVGRCGAAGLRWERGGITRGGAGAYGRGPVDLLVAMSHLRRRVGLHPGPDPCHGVEPTLDPSFVAMWDIELWLHRCGVDFFA